MNRFKFGVCLAALCLAANSTSALPVIIHFSGEVRRENCIVCTGTNPFGGFFSVGDLFEGIIKYDPANKTVIDSFQDSTTLTTYFALHGASMSVAINGEILESDPTEPLISRVASWQAASIFNIDAWLVPHSDVGVPEQVGPHGITELSFALQDNSGAAFGTLFADMPSANSPIFSVLKGFSFIGDSAGLCSVGTCYGSFPEGIAQTTLSTVSATEVPEPAAWALMSAGWFGGWRVVRKKKRPTNSRS